MAVSDRLSARPRGAPTFTAVALIVLALGIGAAAVFSVVDAVVLRGLPYRNVFTPAALNPTTPAS